jgi:hypothetical protein
MTTPQKGFITSSKETKTPNKKTPGITHSNPNQIGLTYPDSETNDKKEEIEEEPDNYYFNYIEQFEDEDFDP